MEYKYISADNHVDTRWLPNDLWQKRLPRRFGHQAPHVIETPKGAMWEWEGSLHGDSADGSRNAELRQQIFGCRGLESPEGSLPSTDPDILLKHMDACNTWAGVFFGDTRKWDVKDDDLRREMYRAFNDFALELNATAPDRILVLPRLPSMDQTMSIAEMRRVARQGAKAVEFSPLDADPPLWDRSWEPLWAGAEELGIPICFHIGDKSGTPYAPNEFGRSFALFSLAPFSAAPGMAQVIFSGVFERHPRLHISVAECRIGWLPFFISWMDRQIRERAPDPTAPLSLLPSEYFARNMSATFEDDLIGARLLTEDWAHLRNSAVWGGDYPHPQGVWPDIDPVMDELFQGVDPDLKQEIVFNRAARIFKLNTPVISAASRKT
jgi:predicted TIM-barrel fold metal-dependent hydrolase